MDPENITRIPTMGKGPGKPLVRINNTKQITPSAITFTRRWFLILRFRIVVTELSAFQTMEKINVPASHQLKVRVTPNTHAKESSVSQRSEIENQSYKNG